MSVEAEDDVEVERSCEKKEGLIGDGIYRESVWYLRRLSLSGGNSEEREREHEA